MPFTMCYKIIHTLLFAVQAVREGIDIALVALSMLSGASVVASIVITGIHNLHGCKCVKVIYDWCFFKKDTVMHMR